MSSRRRTALGGDIDHLDIKGTNPLWNEWEEDEQPKEFVKKEPTPPKSSPPAKQVWKKVTSSESQEVQPSGSPSPRLDDAPEG